MAADNIKDEVPSDLINEGQGYIAQNDLSNVPDDLQSVDPDYVASQVDPRNAVLGGAAAKTFGQPVTDSMIRHLAEKEAKKKLAAQAAASAPRGVYNPTGASVEQSVANWRSYNEAQNEAAKGIRRDTALNKKYPNYTRPSTTTLSQTAKVAEPGILQQAKNKIYEESLKRVKPGAVHGTVRGLGRAVAGGAAGYDLVNAYNRALEGDYTGAAISGVGALGGLASMAPHPVARGVGTAVAMGAPMLNSYLDNKKKQEKAEGGVVGYAGGKQVLGGLEAAKKLFTPKQTKILRASEALGPHEGKYLNLTQSDRMRSTGGDLGGPGFSKFQLENPDYAGAAWGVGNKPTASGIVNINKRYPEGKAIWAPMIGSESQHRSNQHVYDALTDEFNRQVSMGNLTPELRQAMNARLASTPKYSHLGLNEIDVANPEHVKNLGNTFDRRAAISEVLGGEGVGGRKGQIFDYPGVMQEMTDPMTIGAPTHSMGTRLFTLNNEVEHRPDLHSAFPFILKGDDMGVAFNPVPKELAYPSWINMAKEFTGREPGYMELTRGIKGQGKPHQFIDEKYLRALEDAGHKEGGSTTPAWQRKEGKNPEGGLNAVGRASYNRETGGNLKAPQPEGGARKDSFCARMEGMKKKNTSSATANDPDSRINKSLRKWKC